MKFNSDQVLLYIFVGSASVHHSEFENASAGGYQ